MGRWIRRILLVIVVVYGVVVMTTFMRVRSFRQHPHSSAAMNLIPGDWPHNLLARLLILKPGTPGYNRDVRNWIYEAGRLSDTFWNRRLLERDLAGLSPDIRALFLSRYPLSPTVSLLPLIKEALYSDSYAVLPLLNRVEGDKGQEVYRTWIEEEVLRSLNKKRFIGAAEYIFQSTVVDPFKLFEVFWPRLDDEERNSLLHTLSQSLPAGVGPTDEILKWTDRTLAEKTLAITDDVALLLGRFLSFPDKRSEALALAGREINRFQPAQVASLFTQIPADGSEQIAQTLLGRAKERNPQVAIALLRQVAESNILSAEATANPILAEPDSELRKGVIVILVLHGSALGQAHIDEAFRGSAPRRTMFRNTADYIYGSAAADRYRLLAGHDYQETGKTWPPSVIKSPLVADESVQWSNFVDTYPWFPGTDDAYYRWAYGQYAAGNYKGALSIIREYLKKELPDDDARPYMMYLLGNIARADTSNDVDFPALAQIRLLTTSPLGQLVFEDQPAIEPVLAAIDFSLSSANSTALLGATKEQLITMRRVAEIIRTAPLQLRFSSIINELKGKEGLLPAVLYGKFFTPMAATQREPMSKTDPADVTLQVVSDRLAYELSSVRGAGEVRDSKVIDRIAWTLLHFSNFEIRYDASFDKVFRLLAKLDSNSLPPALRDEHKNLVQFVLRGKS